MPTRETFLVFALGLLGSAWTIAPAAAATASASISVSATVQASCVASVNATTIGTHAEAADPSSAVAVNCTNSAQYNIAVNPGAAQNATIAFRPGSSSRFPLLTRAPRAFTVQAANPVIVVVTY